MQKWIDSILEKRLEIYKWISVKFYIIQALKLCSSDGIGSILLKSTDVLMELVKSNADPEVRFLIAKHGSETRC